MIQREEIPVLKTGQLLKVHEGCITLESNNPSDTIWEQMDVKNSISILLTEQEAEKVYDWYICAAGRSRFMRLFKDKRYTEHIDRRIADESLYLLDGTEKYVLQITWMHTPIGDEENFVVCSSCGDPFDIKYTNRNCSVHVCPWCKSGRT